MPDKMSETHLESEFNIAKEHLIIVLCISLAFQVCWEIVEYMCTKNDQKFNLNVYPIYC